jgi:phosphoglucosamine mutase
MAMLIVLCLCQAAADCWMVMLVFVDDGAAAEEERQAESPVVIGTLMTNFSLERMLREEGIALTRVAVGDRYVFEEMTRSGALLGGESRHV